MKKYGIELYNISIHTCKDIWTIPYKNDKEKLKFEALYDRAYKLYWTKLYNEQDTKTLDEIINLIIDSSFYYNSQFGYSKNSTQYTGK